MEERAQLHAPWKPGQSGNPAGKPKGCVSGRAKALSLVDECLSKAKNTQRLTEALDDALQKKPLWFFVNIVMPLLPKESKGTLESGDRVIEWRGLLSVCGGQTTGAVPADGATDHAFRGSSGDAGFVAGSPYVDPVAVGAAPAQKETVAVPSAGLPFPVAEEKPPF